MFTAIDPEHTRVQERASFFLCFPSISHFSRAVSRKKGIPVRCFSSHESKAHPPPSGRGPDREERLKKNSQSSVVQKAVAGACGRHSTMKPSKKKSTLGQGRAGRCPGPNFPLEGRQGSRGCIPGSPGESGLVSRGSQGLRSPLESRRGSLGTKSRT